MNQKAEVERLAQLRLGKESLPHVNAGDAPEWRSHDGVSSCVGGAFAENGHESASVGFVCWRGVY